MINYHTSKHLTIIHLLKEITNCCLALMQYNIKRKTNGMLKKVQLHGFLICRKRKNYLLVEDGLCLATITRLLPVVTPLPLSRQAILTFLILSNLVESVLPTLLVLAVSLLCFRHVHLQVKPWIKGTTQIERSSCCWSSLLSSSTLHRKIKNQIVSSKHSLLASIIRVELELGVC